MIQEKMRFLENHHELIKRQDRVKILKNNGVKFNCLGPVALNTCFRLIGLAWNYLSFLRDNLGKSTEQKLRTHA